MKNSILSFGAVAQFLTPKILWHEGKCLYYTVTLFIHNEIRFTIIQTIWICLLAFLESFHSKVVLYLAEGQKEES